MFLSYFEQKLLADEILLSKATLIIEESLKNMKKSHQGNLKLRFSIANETNFAFSFQKNVTYIFLMAKNVAILNKEQSCKLEESFVEHL
jgi:hypothetical protein